MGIQNLVRWLLPREDHFYDFLEKQSVVCFRGAEALATFKDPKTSADNVRDAVQLLEHEGDKLVHEMEEALAKTFVTPIDREDLQHLSIELDDILDRTNGAARSCVLYGVDQPTPPMKRQMDILLECTGLLKTALPSLRRHAYGELISSGRTMRKLEKDGDQIFRAAISDLFHDPKIDSKVLLREKQVLEELESAIDHCHYVAGRLTNLAVKHG